MSNQSTEPTSMRDNYLVICTGFALMGLVVGVIAMGLGVRAIQAAEANDGQTVATGSLPSATGQGSPCFTVST